MHSKNYHPVSPEEAVSIIRSGDKIFVHSVAAAPQVLIKALVQRADDLRNIEIYQLHTEELPRQKYVRRCQYAKSRTSRPRRFYTRLSE